jgi:hypothetical protein
LNLTRQVIQGGGGQYFINPTPAVDVVTLVRIGMQFRTVGSGSLCFKYRNSVQPAATNGWRDVGTWTVVSICNATNITGVFNSTNSTNATIATNNASCPFTHRLTITIPDSFSSMSRRAAHKPRFEPTMLKRRSHTPRGQRGRVSVARLRFSALAYDAWLPAGYTVGFVLPVGAAESLAPDVNCSVVSSSVGVLGCEVRHVGFLC